MFRTKSISAFFSTTRCEDTLELLDLPIQNLEELHESLRDVEWFLTKLGLGSWTRAYFRRTVARVSTGAGLRVLDAGTGSGWLAKSLLDFENDVDLRIVALDLNPMVLECAQRNLGHTYHRTVDFQVGDVRNLDFPAGTFDFVCCSSVLHHLKSIEVVQAIREIDRVSRGSWVICDLRRTLGAYWAARVATSVFSRNRLTRNDGPLSFKRAFTIKEVKELVAQSGIPQIKCERWGPLCLGLIRTK